MVEVTVQVTVEVEARTPANSILDRERQRVGPSARVVVVELRAEREREYRWRGFLYVFRHDHFLNGQADIFGEFVNFGTQHVFFFGRRVWHFFLCVPTQHAFLNIRMNRLYDAAYILHSIRERLRCALLNSF